MRTRPSSGLLLTLSHPQHGQCAHTHTSPPAHPPTYPLLSPAVQVILKDLKGLDKLAKGKQKEEVAAASAALRGHVLEFVELEPTRLVERFGVTDL